MDTTTKFKLKRRVKLLRWLAWGCIFLFAIILTTLFIVRKHSDADWSKPLIIIPVMLGLVLPLFAGLILTMYSSFNLQYLMNYRKQILTYRARKFAHRAIEFLQQGNVRAAVDEYIKCKRYPEHSLDDYVYGMLISAALLTGDEKLKKIGLEKTNGVKEEYNPDLITF
jgi:hypothetical protein